MEVNYLSHMSDKNNNWIKNNTTEILDNYISVFKGKYNKDLYKIICRIKDYLSLKVLVKDENSPLNNKVKENLKLEFEKSINKNFSLIKNIFIRKTIHFGNQIIALNNLIYYCEILGIKNFYLNSAINWYIKNDIKTNKIHISILSNSAINCSSYENFCVNSLGFFIFPKIIKPERRSLLLKEEIKRNLPKLKLNENDLYIYIRSGDSFQLKGNHYTPVPYCFYQILLSSFKFNDIYIISVDDKSPIIGKLLSDYPEIKHRFNSLETDFTILMNAYNLANSVSSFSQAAISFNDNLKNLFEYEVYELGTAIIHFHYDIDKLDKKFNVYRMKPSNNYFIKMFSWENTEEQRKLLFEEKCVYTFQKTKYTKTIFD